MREAITLSLLINDKSCFESLESKVKSEKRIKMFLYPPSYPRRYFTVQLIGEWDHIVSYKREIVEKIDEASSTRRGELSHKKFQQMVLHQSIKYSFKSLKRYILEKDIRLINHWEFVSTYFKIMELANK